MHVSTPKSFRYERKFICRDTEANAVDWILRTHSYHFREVFRPRRVNNIYFDTWDFRHYQENMDGIRDRIKPRIRWYGAMTGRIAKPVLEFKIKRGLAGHKRSFPLPGFEVPNQCRANDLKRILDPASLPPDACEFMKHLQPTLVNSYHRRYYLSSDGQCRITMDDELSFHELRHNRLHRKPGEYDRDIILEIKYDRDSVAGIDAISNAFRFRLNRFSKYVAGIETLHA